MITVRRTASRPYVFPIAREEVRSVALVILELLNLQEASLIITLSDDSQVAGLNRDFLGCCGPTNVLSFPADSAFGADYSEGDFAGTEEVPESGEPLPAFDFPYDAYSLQVDAGMVVGEESGEDFGQDGPVVFVEAADEFALHEDGVCPDEGEGGPVVFNWESGDDDGGSPDVFLPADADLGEVALSIDTLVREAGLYGQPVFEHFVRLLAHALLHLAGYDHGEKMYALTDEAVARVLEESEA